MVAESVDLVDPEFLFQHIRALEGDRHPITNFEGLEAARKYITEEFEKYGYKVKLQEFKQEGFDKPFYNIEAFLDDQHDEDSIFLVTSHYDSVMRTPGADDNASAVSIMLETARIIKNLDFAKKVRFVCFTLEENNPTIQLQALTLGKELGLINKDNKPSNLSFLENNKEFLPKLLTNRAKGSTTIFDDTLEEMKNKLSPIEEEYFQKIYGNFQNMKSDYGNFALIGSHYYVNSLSNTERIAGILNYDPIGFTNKKPNSQTVLEALDPAQIPKNNTSDDLSVGDFASVFTIANSEKFGELFLNGAKDQAVDLATAWIHFPYDIATITKGFPDILRSDHYPFWKIGIPGLFLSDTADFRNPNYHLEGDTLDTLDFDFMKKVCQTTIKFLSDLLS